jgi:MurNAc alpha-1-phosphate uridylyltransferase
MLNVAGEPLLARQLRALGAAGFTDVVINLHHLGEQIEAAFGDGRTLGLCIRYSREPQLLETGGGIVNALPLLGDEPFLVLNGDIYTDFQFEALPASLADWADAHLVVTPTPPSRAAGDFDVASGRITRRGPSHVYCGIAILRPSLFAGRRPEPFSLREILFDAVARGAASGQVWTGLWSDIGSPEALADANRAAL